MSKRNANRGRRSAPSPASVGTHALRAKFVRDVKQEWENFTCKVLKSIPSLFRSRGSDIQLRRASPFPINFGAKNSRRLWTNYCVLSYWSSCRLSTVRQLQRIVDSSSECRLSEESRFKKNIEVSPIGNFSNALRPCLQNLLRVFRQLIASKRDDERKPTFHYVETYVNFQYQARIILSQCQRRTKHMDSRNIVALLFILKNPKRFL